MPEMIKIKTAAHCCCLLWNSDLFVRELFGFGGEIGVIILFILIAV